MRRNNHRFVLYSVSAILITYLALTQGVSAQTLNGQKGFYCSASLLYDLMTDDFYDIYSLLDNGMGYEIALGFRFSRLLDLEVGYWSSSHNAYPLNLTPEGKAAGIFIESESMQFFGIELHDSARRSAGEIERAIRAGGTAIEVLGRC